MIKPAEEIGAAEDALYPAKSSSGIELMSINLLLDKETTPVIYRGPIIAQTVEEFWTNVIWGDIDIMFIDMPLTTAPDKSKLSKTSGIACSSLCFSTTVS